MSSTRSLYPHVVSRRFEDSKSVFPQVIAFFAAGDSGQLHQKGRSSAFFGRRPVTMSL
jgi:hypothetical protein